MKRLKIGDPVMWRGGWGNHEPKLAIVTGISIVAQGKKYGREAKSAAWSTVLADRAVVDLDNGHWAYGSQLSEANPC